MGSEEEAELAGELELPHLPDMLFLHNRLRCAHASGFHLEVRIFMRIAAFIPQIIRPASFMDKRLPCHMILVRSGREPSSVRYEPCWTGSRTVALSLVFLFCMYVHKVGHPANT
jgi:hypothetical protein